MTTSVTIENQGPGDVLVKTKNSGYPDQTLKPGSHVNRYVYDNQTVEVSEFVTPPVPKE
jgi:hypothetical protein